MINIAIIEDDEEIREMLISYFSKVETFNCVADADSVEGFLAKCDKKTEVDAIILDIGLPKISGIEGIPIIKSRFPGADILMLSVHDDEERIFKSLCAGASGYILKHTPIEKIKEAVESLAEGGAPMSPKIARKVIEYFNPKKKRAESELTQREREITAALVDGASYSAISECLNISIHTVRQHIRSIYKKLHVNSKAEVISKSFRGEI